MLAGWSGVALVGKEFKGLADAAAGVARENHFIDEAELRGVEGVGKVVAVHLNEIDAGFVFVGCHFDFFTVDNIDGAFGAHHGDFRGGVGEVDVAA